MLPLIAGEHIAAGQQVHVDENGRVVAGAPPVFEPPVTHMLAGAERGVADWEDYLRDDRRIT